MNVRVTCGTRICKADKRCRCERSRHQKSQAFSLGFQDVLSPSFLRLSVTVGHKPIFPPSSFVIINVAERGRPEGP